MYKGKHSAQASVKPENRPVRSAAPRRRVGSARKNMGLIVALALILSIAVGGTVAWLTSNVAIKNTMVPGNVPVEIVEQDNGSVKSQITVFNRGNVQAYMRVAIVCNNFDGTNVLLGNSSTTHASIDTTTNWQLMDDGFYYYKGVVEPTKGVNLLKDSINYENAEVVVMAQTVQVLGTFTEGTASQKLWGHTYNPLSNSWA